MRRAALLVLALLAAGCSDPGAPQGPDTPAPEGPDGTSEPGGRVVSDQTLVGRVIRTPRELHNESYEFPGANDPPLDDVVPVADALRLELRFTSNGDCPLQHTEGDAALLLTSPNGTVLEVALSSAEAYSRFCDPAAGVSRQPYNEGHGRVDAETGDWRLSSRGSFNGDVRVVVIADPRE